jgi:hypothetical protein
MKRTALEIYALAVCFFTVACFVIVLGVAIWNVVSIAVPQFTMSNYQWSQFRSDDAYSQRLVNTHGCKQNYAPPTGQALTEARVKALNDEIASEQHGAVTELVHNLIILLIDVLVFLPHWKLGARARQSVG